MTVSPPETWELNLEAGDEAQHSPPQHRGSWKEGELGGGAAGRRPHSGLSSSWTHRDHAVPGELDPGLLTAPVTPLPSPYNYTDNTSHVSGYGGPWPRGFQATLTIIATVPKSQLSCPVRPLPSRATLSWGFLAG